MRGRNRTPAGPAGARAATREPSDPASRRAPGAHDLSGKETECDTPERQPQKSRALEEAGIVRVDERRLARLPEEDDSIELHHDVGGESRRERHQRGTER